MPVAEWDKVADSYEATLESTTEGFVPRYVDLIGESVADIGAGPGVVAMAAAADGAVVLATDLSAPMVARLAARAAENGVADRVRAFVADAQVLPLRDGSVDAAVSNFGIIFCPDVDAALREMVRVACATVAFTVWTNAARNGWTWLLPAGYADDLGFAFPVRPMFKWSSIDEVRAWRARGAGGPTWRSRRRWLRPPRSRRGGRWASRWRGRRPKTRWPR